MQIDDGGAAWHASATVTPTSSAAREPVPDLAEQVNRLRELVAGSDGMRCAVEQICGLDSFAWLTGLVAGSWQDVSAAGEAMDQLGEWAHVTRAELDGVLTSSASAREGDGEPVRDGDPVMLALAGIGQALMAVEAAAAGLALDLRATAHRVYVAGDVAVSLLGELCDYLVALAIDLIATTTAGPADAEHLLGGASSAYLTWEAFQVWEGVQTWSDRAATHADDLAGLCAKTSTLLDGVAGLEVPCFTVDLARTGSVARTGSIARTGS
ncbi:hypothetical protein [Cellulomonas sp. KRMCY2]|uniref:hypothetical protein n=1 Tax=Cellulomonas sp. KRMCY2 TaxID=1304865 RepID=UPI00045E6145|nr:hypothetical protein [Cellulomonas sp. KRMCY2]